MQRSGLQSALSIYVRSLNLVALAAIAIVFVRSMAVFVSSAGANPSQYTVGAAFMLFLLLLLLALFVFIEVWLVFGVAQILLARIAAKLERAWTSGSILRVASAVPIAALISWFCFDYLVPEFAPLTISSSPDWRPFEHGITMQRYATTLLLQAAITAFSIWRHWQSIPADRCSKSGIIVD